MHLILTHINFFVILETVRIIDYISRQQICESTYTMPGHSILWLPKIVDPKGSTVAAGFSDGVVRLFAFQQRESIDIHGRFVILFKPFFLIYNYFQIFPGNKRI